MPERINPTDADWWPEYGFEHIQRYAFASKYCNSGVGLDFGCGVGYGTEILARSGAKIVIGLDQNKIVIKSAKERSVPKNIYFLNDLKEAKKYAPDGFDFIVMFEVIEHLHNPTEVLNQIADNLKNDSFLIISAPNKLMFSAAQEPIKNEFHLNEPTYKEIVNWLNPRFQIYEEFEQSFLSYQFRNLLKETVKQSAFLKIERLIRRIIKKPILINHRKSEMVKSTEIFPLIIERRAYCNQFVFVAKKK